MDSKFSNEIKIAPLSMVDQGLIDFEMDLMGDVSRQVASLQDQVVRQQLEEAGWLSPEAAAALRAQVEALTVDLETERAAFKTCAQERYACHFDLVNMRYQLTAATNERDALRSRVEALTSHVKVLTASLRATGVPQALLERMLADAAPSPLTRPVVPDLDNVDWPDVEDMAHGALQEALSFGLSHDVINRFGQSVMQKTRDALLAAAPDLLAFAEWVLSLKTGGLIEGKARAAIARATGKGE